MRDFLLTGIDYDLWANRTWQGFFQKLSDPEQVFAVLSHILTSQRTWLERVTSVPASRRSEGLEGSFQIAHEEWRTVLSTRNLDEVIAYTNSRGVSYERPIGEIAWHVINHGTYHRGQIRTIAESQGTKDWPETDLIRFFDEMRGPTPN